MARITFIVAQSRNGVIGRNGALPWRLSSDLRHFKTLTLGKPVIMGRKTWESLPRKPLPGRDNIVVTRERGYPAGGAIVVHAPEAALVIAEELARRSGVDEVAVIGGAEIFSALLHRAQRIYLTEVDLEVEGDTRFPPLDRKEWRQTEVREFPRGANDQARFRVVTLERQTQASPRVDPTGSPKSARRRA
jgi:dihydrofolate reductase